MEKPITTLGYALLGLLARQSLSGYDLARQMKAPVGFFWQARHSQIYPELARLQTLGLVTSELIEQQDRPDKKLYTITEAGREALRSWATEPAAPAPIRSELVLKAHSVWLADRPKAAALFREEQRRHEAQLAQYEGYRVDMERGLGDALRQVDSSHFASYATLRRGIGYERELIEWCRWVADQLEGGARETPG